MSAFVSLRPESGMALSVGNRVQATDNLNIRNSPSLGGQVLGTAAAGALGTILNGPTSADGYTWWYIDWDSYSTGWSVSTYLVVASPPTAPSGLVAYATESVVSLAWYDNSSNESGFKVERKIGSGGTWSQITTTGASAAAYLDYSITPGTTYYYRVRAYNSVGNSAYSNEVSATPTVAVPTTPGPLETQAFSDRVELGWTDNSSNETGFKVERRVGAGSWSQIATVSGGSGNGKFYTDYAVTSHTTYSYRVRAYNDGGNSGYSNEVTLTTPAGRPGSFSLSNETPYWDPDPPVPGPAVRLNWTASTDAGGYAIYRNGSLYAAGISGTTYLNEANLTPGATYTYFIRASNAEGTTDSNTISVTMPEDPSSGVPGAFTLSNETPYWDPNPPVPGPAVRLNWTASSGAASYAVYRNSSLYASGITGTTYLNEANLTPGATYTYFIRASNAQGVRDSNTISVDMPEDPANVPVAPTNLEAQAFSGRVELGWTDNSSDETGFKVERRIGAASWSQIATVSGGSGNAKYYTDNGVSSNTSYSYRVRAYHAGGNSGYSNEVTLMTPAGPPGPFTLSNEAPYWDTTSPAGPAVRLNWTASSDAGAYAVYRNGVVYNAGITGTTFLNNANLIAGATYTYFIRASNAEGTRDSNTIAVTMPSGPSVVGIQIDVPNGGEVFEAGESNEILWYLSAVPEGLSYFRILFSQDGGSSFSTIVPSVGADLRAHNWSIPSATATTRGRIRVEGRNSQGQIVATGTSAANFAVAQPVEGPRAVIDGQTAAQSGHQVTFSGANSTAPAGIVSWEWDFGDGQTGSGVSLNHAFSAVGQQNFTVTLTVTDGMGYTDVETMVITVTGLAAGFETPSSYSSDPVNLATGSYVYSHTDLGYPSRGFGFRFTRTYNAQDSQFAPGPLGHRWTHSYNLHLFDGPSGEKVVLLGDGRRQTFFPNEDGGYDSEPGVHEDLLDAGDGTLVLATRSRLFYSFDANGRLASIVDRNSNTVSLSYTAEGWLDAITDTAGRTVDFQNDSVGRITQITDPAGRSVRFEYDSNGDLVRAFDAANNQIQYAYDAEHQLTSARDPNGNEFVRNTYDAMHRVVTAQRDALGHETRFQYDPVSRVTTVTDPLGKVTIHRHDERLRVVAITDALSNVESYEYDGDDNRTRVTDRNGNVTEYEYDAAGNVVRLRDPLGAETLLAYTSFNDPEWQQDAVGTVTRYSYDDRGNLTETSVDGIGMRSAFEYDAYGQVTALLNGASNRTERAYDTNGYCIVVRDPENGETWKAYDAAGRVIAETNGVGMVKLYSHDPTDHLLSVIEPEGATRFSVYDPNGNRIMEIDPLNRTNAFAYDAKDRLVATTNAMGGVTRYGYDALDRRTNVIDAAGASTVSAYDAVGNLIRVTDPTGRSTTYSYDANRNRTSKANAAGEIVRYSYDALNRVVSTTDPLGNTSSTAYDLLGRMASKTDALGRVTSFEYDTLGRMTNVTDPAGGTVGYEYDAADRRTRVVDPNGNGTSYQHDGAGRVIQKTEPSGYSYFYTHDAAARLTSRTDPNGVTISNLYDEGGYLAEVRYPSNSVHFAYDIAGRRTQMIDQIGTNTWLYDGLDQVLERTDGFGNTVAYGYDAVGHRTNLTYPGGKSVAYSYDAAGRMLGLLDWTGGRTVYRYDTAGRLVKALNPNGTKASYSYDDAGRLLSLTNSAPDGSPISAYALVLDPVGNPTSIDQEEPIEAQLSTTNIAYAYDGDGRLLTANEVEFAYDANGNTIAIGSDELHYDAEDRLVKSVFGGTTNEYRYDALNHRVEKDVGGVVTRYVTDTAMTLPQVLMETEKSGVPKASYVYGLGLVSRITPTGEKKFYHYNTRGDAVGLSSENGITTDAYTCSAFGRVLNAIGSTDNPFVFLAQHGIIKDSDTIVHVRRRYYLPGLGRFLTKDIALPDGTRTQNLNKYCWAVNRAFKMIDASGLSPRDADIWRGSGASEKYYGSGQALDDLSGLYLELLGAFGEDVLKSAFKDAVASDEVWAWVLTKRNIPGAIGPNTAGWTKLNNAFQSASAVLTLISVIENAGEEVGRDGFGGIVEGNIEFFQDGGFNGLTTEHWITALSSMSAVAWNSGVAAPLNTAVRYFSEGELDIALRGDQIEDFSYRVGDYGGDFLYGVGKRFGWYP